MYPCSHRPSLTVLTVLNELGLLREQSTPGHQQCNSNCSHSQQSSHKMPVFHFLQISWDTIQTLSHATKSNWDDTMKRTVPGMSVIVITDIFHNCCYRNLLYISSPPFQQRDYLHTHHLAGCRVVKDVVHPSHLSQHSPKCQEVTCCVQPGMKLGRTKADQNRHIIFKLWPHTYIHKYIRTFIHS